MELSEETIEAFRKAYKQDTGEDLSFKQAHEIAHRLVSVFQILEKAAKKRLNKRLLTGDAARK